MLKELNRSSVNRKNFYRIEMQLRDKLLEVPPPRINLQIDVLRRPSMKTPEKFLVRATNGNDQFINETFNIILGGGSL
ncbi:hypothetical protein J3A64_000262 [Pseudarthrobacter sp. PvP004]|nr:hypothetical protein [Pseudarthrobacter sp. PvP004]